MLGHRDAKIPRPGVALSPATAAAQATGHAATDSLAPQQSGPGVVANSVRRVLAHVYAMQAVMESFAGGRDALMVQ